MGTLAKYVVALRKNRIDESSQGNDCFSIHWEHQACLSRIHFSKSFFCNRFLRFLILIFLSQKASKNILQNCAGCPPLLRGRGEPPPRRYAIFASELAFFLYFSLWPGRGRYGGGSSNSPPPYRPANSSSTFLFILPNPGAPFHFESCSPAYVTRFGVNRVT